MMGMNHETISGEIKRWAQQISGDREKRLRELSDRWDANRQGAGPFEGVTLDGGDVYFLARYTLYRELGSEEMAERKLREAGAGGIAGGGAGVNLKDLNLRGVNLAGAHLEDAVLSYAVLEHATLSGTHLANAQLGHACLADATLTGADLRGANLSEVIFGDADVAEARLDGANLRRASFGKAATLHGASFSQATLDQVIFDSTNLRVVEWSKVHQLGDEIQARQSVEAHLSSAGKKRLRKVAATRAADYKVAAWAYRALAVMLSAQGIGGDAARFHVRAELMDCYWSFHDERARIAPLHPIRALRGGLHWVGRCLLWGFTLLSAHLGWIMLTYIMVVSSFAVAYYLAGQLAFHLPEPRAILDALSFSLSAFHGRGVPPPGLQPLSDQIAGIAGVEAVFGLLLEGLFIAAFTRRVTGN